MDYTAILKARF